MVYSLNIYDKKCNFTIEKNIKNANILTMIRLCTLKNTIFINACS